MGNKRRGSPRATQLALPNVLGGAATDTSGEPYPSGAEETPAAITVPVDPTFDVGQGLREIKTVYSDRGAEVIFDWRHISLAEEYLGGEPDPLEPFVTERGGLISLATPMNVFRCHGTAERWASDTLGKSIPVEHTPPVPGTTARLLFDALGIERVAAAMAGRPGDLVVPDEPYLFQSRYVSPIMLVNASNKRPVISAATEWVMRVQTKGNLKFALLKAMPEIVTNIVNHGVDGALLVSIWPIGQVEILWSNRIRGRDSVFAMDTAREAATGIMHGHTGAGLGYILDQLLPEYCGTLAINFKGSDIVLHSGRRVDIYNQGRRGPQFTADSILFSLHIYSADARRKGD